MNSLYTFSAVIELPNSTSNEKKERKAKRARSHNSKKVSQSKLNAIFSSDEDDKNSDALTEESFEQSELGYEFLDNNIHPLTVRV